MLPILRGGIALAIVILIIAAISIRGQRGGVVEERLGRYTEVGSFISVPEEETKEKKKETSALTERIEGLLQNRSFASKWRTSLARADLKLTVTEFLALHVIACFGLMLIAYIVVFPGNIIATIVAGGVGLFLPRIYVNRSA